MDEQIRVAVLGGGLAGMVATLKLVQRGFDVTLYESSNRLGGKAGSDSEPKTYNADFSFRDEGLPEGVQSDHGYHLFPVWYTNMRALWDEIGLKPADCYAGMAPKNLKVYKEGDGYKFEDNAKRPWRAVISLLDLISRNADEVQEQTLKGFLSSRLYNGPESVTFGRLLLNALTIKEYDVSARTLRTVFRQWLPVIKGANWTALKGSLGELLIDKIEAEIKNAEYQKIGGAIKIELNAKVSQLEIVNGKLRAEFDQKTKKIDAVENVPIILALPQEVLRELNNDEIYEIEPALGNLQYLNSNTFGGLDIFFDKKIEGIAKEHFRLDESRYALTAFAASEHWPSLQENYKDKTVLQFVAGGVSGLNKLGVEGYLKTLQEDIVKYIPEVEDHVAFYVPHQNISYPLFVNDVGVWDYRPEVVSQIDDVYFAGDFVQHGVDVASMEGAVRSGLNAAEAVRKKYAAGTSEIKEIPGPAYSDVRLFLIRLFMPVISVIAWFVYRVPEYIRGLVRAFN